MAIDCIKPILRALCCILFAASAQAQESDPAEALARAAALVARHGGDPAHAQADWREIDALRARLAAIAATSGSTDATGSREAVLQMQDQLDRIATVPVVRAKTTLALGTISGTLTDAVGGTPVSATVRAFEYSLNALPTGAGVIASINSSAVDGSYSLTLPAGNYLIRVTSPGLPAGYLQQVYNGQLCRSTTECPNYFGTIVALADGGAVGAIDFALVQGGSITGTVTVAAGGAPVSGATVNALSEDGLVSLSANTLPSGQYTLAGLPPGQYVVSVRQAASSGLGGKAWPNVVCGTNDCSLLADAGVAVSNGQATTNIDFALDPGSNISGTVTAAATSLPIVSAPPIVTLISEDRVTSITSGTDAAGAYVFGPLRPGRYRVFAAPPNFLRTVNPGRPCLIAPLCGTLAESDWIVVGGPGQGVSGINFSLPAGASVQATVRNAQTLAAISGASVSMSPLPLTSFQTVTATSNPSGLATLGGLFDGPHTLRVTATGYNIATLTVTPSAASSPLVLTVDMTPAAASNAATTGISGVIYDTTTNLPMPANVANVFARNEATGAANGNSQRLNVANGRVEYTVNVAPGNYKVTFSTGSNAVLNQMPAAYGGEICGQTTCNPALSPSVTVTDGAITPNIDVSLVRGAALRARLTDATTGRPADRRGVLIGEPNSVGTFGTLVTFLGIAGPGVAATRSDRTGTHMFRGVVPGVHYLRTTNFVDYINEQYDDVPCTNFFCTTPQGTPIAVGSTDVSGIEIALATGGTITGRVSAAQGDVPLAYVPVLAHDSAGQVLSRTNTDDAGRYRISRLRPGTYYITTLNQYGLLDELHAGLPCEPFCNPTEGTPVTVVGTGNVSGIDFALDAGATVSGTVRRAGNPAAGITVEIYGGTGASLASANTAIDGSYAFPGLAAGTFYLRTRNALSLLDGLYDGQSCIGSCVVTNGTPLVVTAGANVGAVDLVVADPGAIAGTVTRAANATPVGGLRIDLLDASANVLLTTTSESTGTYRFNGLAAGNYRVVTRGAIDLIDLAYATAPCAANCSGVNGVLVPVVAGSTTNAIDFQLAAGGSIAGTVAQSGTPRSGVLVELTDAAGVTLASTTTDAAGAYRFGKLVDASYRLKTSNSIGLLDEVFDDRPCSGTCDLANGDAVNVSSGGAVTGVDFDLALGGGISGTVQGPGGAVAGVEVAIYDAAGVEAGRATSNGTGAYVFTGLAPGLYRLRTFNSADLVDEVYPDRGCSPAPCVILDGAPVTVEASTVPGVDFALAAGGTISGTASDESNNPLLSGSAELLGASGALITSSAIQTGLWQFRGVANGTYYVLIRNTSGLVDQLYDSVDCPGGNCDVVASGTPIIVSGLVAPSATNAATGSTAVTVRLPPGRRIAGRITDALTAQGIAAADLFVFGADGNEAASARADAIGNYRIESGLPPGTYFVATANGQTRGAPGYVNALYAGSVCLLECNVVAGTPVVLGASNVSGIDLALDPADASITGMVTRSGGAPVSLVEIRVVDAGNRLAGTARTDSLGGYRIDGLVQGSYFAVTRNALQLEDRAYGGALCPPGCDPTTTTAIAVTTAATTSGIDIQIDPRVQLFADGFEDL